MFLFLDSGENSDEGSDNQQLGEETDFENSSLAESSDDGGLYGSSNDNSYSGSDERDSSGSSDSDSSASTDESALYDSTDTDNSNNSESESDSDSDISIFENEENLNEQLYNRAPVTVSDIIIAIICLTFRHKLSNICLANILSLVSLVCLRPNNCISSLYKFNKILQDFRCGLERIFYCEDCSKQLNDSKSKCDACGDDAKTSFFIKMPILSKSKDCFRILILSPI